MTRRVKAQVAKIEENALFAQKMAEVARGLKEAIQICDQVKRKAKKGSLGVGALSRSSDRRTRLIRILSTVMDMGALVPELDYRDTDLLSENEHNKQRWERHKKERLERRKRQKMHADRELEARLQAARKEAE